MSDDIQNQQTESTTESVQDTTTPVQEDVKSSEQTEPPESQSAPQFELSLIFQAAPLDVYENILKSRYSLSGDAAFKLAVSQAGSYDNVLYRLAGEGGDFSNEAQRASESIANVAKDAVFENKLVRDGKTILGSSHSHLVKHQNGRVVDGRVARAEFARRRDLTKRISLFNSGFSIDLASATNRDLNLCFSSIQEDINTYGREFGAYFYAFNDLFIKQSIVDMIIPLIHYSNFQGWDTGNTLLSTIKIHDFKVIIHSIAARMHPNGYPFKSMCTHMEDGKSVCDHVVSENIDVSKLLRHNFSKLDAEHVAHMASNAELTHASVLKYQNSLGFSKKIKFDDLELELTVPSIQDYLDFGRQFYADLINSTTGDNTKTIFENLMHSYYRTYTPWVKTLSIITDGTVDLVTSDKDTIAEQLDYIQSDDENQIVDSEIRKFISDTEISHIGYPVYKCPACGHVPETTSGYMTVDPVHAFFTMLLKKLTPS